MQINEMIMNLFRMNCLGAANATIMCLFRKNCERASNDAEQPRAGLGRGGAGCFWLCCCCCSCCCAVGAAGAVANAAIDEVIMSLFRMNCLGATKATIICLFCNSWLADCCGWGDKQATKGSVSQEWFCHSWYI